jgi:hypothetical protein
MLELPASLRQSTLGDVLGALHRHRVSGALRLDEADGAGSASHTIHWLDGLIYDVETPLSVTPFAQLLRREAERARADGLAAERGVPRVDRAAFERALEQQRHERLEALFRLGQARLTFSAMNRSRRPLRPLDPRDFLHGRPRSRDGRPCPHVESMSESLARLEALAVLGLRRGASDADVSLAFKRIARCYHPDLHPHADEGAKAELSRKFTRAALAYHTLRK